LEPLEDRLTPATAGFLSTAPAVISGHAFIDTNNNGVFDASEFGASGTQIVLSGTTAQNTPVNVTTSTDASGQYSFLQVQPGTYTVTRGPIRNFGVASTHFGNLGGTATTDAIADITVAEGQAAVGYDFAMVGLDPSLVSLRDFLAVPVVTPSSFLTTPGSGTAMADGSVQPTGAATPGTASLAGTITDQTGNGVAGVQLALTGLDSTGRSVFQSAASGADGTYVFGGLQGGSFTINITGQPGGLNPGAPTVGTAGGDFFRNDQITHINLPSGTNASGYDFTELPVTAPGGPLGVSAFLADDTAGPGGTTSDGITADASIKGTITSTSPVVSFRAGFDGTPTAGFADVSGNLAADGSFYLNPTRLAQINGGTLPNGAYTLHLQVTDADGRTATFDLAFTVLATPPAIPTLRLDSTSDPGNTGSTTSNVVTILGTTSPGADVQLLLAGNVVATTTADTSGNFSFPTGSLTPGPNDFTVRASDIAGNVSQFQRTFVGDRAPVAVATSPVTTAVGVGNDSFTDLSSPTLFTDPDFSNSVVQFNTLSGPIDVQLFDPQAPQTVANFFDYINQGAYNNDIFHRLSTNFVLQGGGFTFDPTTNTITSVPQGPNLPNEFDNTNRPNVAGTIAMAKLGGNPNSATNQFFFNLVDNTQTLGAGNNGGFTAFGKILDGTGQRTLNTLTSATVVDQSAFNSAFNTLPMNNYNGTNFPTDTVPANYDFIKSVSIVRQTEQLTFTVDSNSTPGVATVSIVDGQLKVHGVSAGTTTVVVRATDLAGASATVTFTVTVS
jgi:cyclophilin family peptidyl-prolyl cis-trans isomerase